MGLILESISFRQPLVSIVTPVYNASRFIKETIESVQNQTFVNWEMILVDDRSNDESVKIIKKYAENDKRIILIMKEKNEGAAEARNLAIQKAKGRFIAFLDSDDVWMPEKLQKQVDFMKNRDIGFSYTYYVMMNEDGLLANKNVTGPEKIVYKDLLKSTIIGCLTVMLDREKIEEITIPNIKPEDTAAWLNILKRGTIAYCLPEYLSKYRLVKGSVSSNRLKAAFRLWNLYRMQEKLNIFQTVWYFSHYVYNAIKKHYIY
jgi:glycosyltransferase involved in cell wall biosynthesis